MSNTESLFRCEGCKRKFSNKYNLNKHVRQRCKLKENVCYRCLKKLATPEHLINHLRSEQCQPSADRGNVAVPMIRCLEAGCNAAFHKLQALQDHLTSYHNMHFEEEERVFQNEMEFQEWKINIEKAFHVAFIIDTTKHGTKYYSCNRSGKDTTLATSSKPYKRKRGKSCKTGIHCTAKLVKKVLEDGRITAKCCKTHYGHEIELLRLHMPTSLRKKLKVMRRFYAGVNQKIFVKRIGESKIRVPDRQSMLILKAVQTIEKSAAMYTQGRHTDDATSVNIFVNEMSEQQEKNPILACKLQGTAQGVNIDGLAKEDIFIVIMHPTQVKMFTRFGSNIVCVDVTQGIKGYSFQVITVLVVDEYGEGFPVAWCLSNQKDNNILVQFFNKIKDKAGRITPQMFMCDEEARYYIAFKHVFGCEPKKLLGTWQVDKAWRRKLSLIKDEDILFQVYTNLVSLRDETDESVFKCKFQEFVQNLHNRGETLEFARYFEQEYSHRYQEWALCFRAADILATDKNVEAAFKIMQYAHLLGKKDKRVDKFLSMLLRYVNDRGYDRLFKIMAGTHTKDIVKIQRRHRTSLSLKLEDVTEEGENSYSVTSGFKTYHVRLTGEVCPDSCGICCEQCKICVHTIYCNCPDSFIKGVLCKHCHLVIRYRERRPNCGPEYEIEYLPLSPSMAEKQMQTEDELMNLLQSHSYTSTSVSADHQLIKDLLADIAAEARKINNPESLQDICSTLKNLLNKIRIYKVQEVYATLPLNTPPCSNSANVNTSHRYSPVLLEQEQVSKVISVTPLSPQPINKKTSQQHQLNFYKKQQSSKINIASKKKVTTKVNAASKEKVSPKINAASIEKIAQKVKAVSKIKLARPAFVRVKATQPNINAGETNSVVSEEQPEHKYSVTHSGPLLVSNQTALLTIASECSVRNALLDTKNKITAHDLYQPAQIVDDVIEFDWLPIQDYLTEGGWKKVAQIVAQKKKNWTCNSCDEISAKFDMIQCGACGLFHHIKCIDFKGNRRDLESMEWVCAKCTLLSFVRVKATQPNINAGETNSVVSEEQPEDKYSVTHSGPLLVSNQTALLAIASKCSVSNALLDTKNKITARDLYQPAQIVDDVIEFDWLPIQDYLTGGAWKRVAQIVAQKKKNWTCNSCDEISAKFDMIRCSACSLFHHIKCIDFKGNRRDLESMDWVCAKCTLPAFVRVKATQPNINAGETNSVVSEEQPEHKYSVTHSGSLLVSNQTALLTKASECSVSNAMLKSENKITASVLYQPVQNVDDVIQYDWLPIQDYLY